MNITDAIKSGRKIRVLGSQAAFHDPKDIKFTPETLLKEWETEDVKESSVLITFNRFDDKS